MNMTREEARRWINSRPLTEFYQLERSTKAGRGMYCCPVCGSGHGGRGTGALAIDPRTKRVTCFAGGCFTDKGEDTLGALRILWDCSEHEVFDRLSFSISQEPDAEGRKAAGASRIQPAAAKPATNYTQFYQDCHDALKADAGALAYLHGRGITDDSIDRFNLGYCAAWKHSKAGPYVKPTPRIIIPRSKKTFVARRIDEPATDLERQYVKQIEGSSKDLFNAGSLDGAEVVFVCEGELDAVSLYQAGAGAVVGIGSTTNTGAFLAAAKDHPQAAYVLALDNDKDKDGKSPGRDAQAKLYADMKAAGLSAVNPEPADVYGSAKDANQALTQDPDRLKKKVAFLLGKAEEQQAEREAEQAADLEARGGEAMLDAFLLQVKSRQFEPLPTGIHDIDRALEGGLVRKTMVMLSGAPGLGKTNLAQWIMENLARAGRDVLYLNLEMSREQLLARSLSRMAWKYGRNDLSTLTVLRGYSWTDEEAAAVKAAADRYRAEIAGRLVYNPDGLSNNIESILQAIREDTARVKALGRPAPIVCVDYLQLVSTAERDAVEGLKNAIKSLKDHAILNDTIVFLITATNRASNKTGVTDLESGRDTSAIEYSCDFMLGMMYTAIDDRRECQIEDADTGKIISKVYDLDLIRELKKQAFDNGMEPPASCNEISLKVLKNRFGQAERRAKLIFDGRHSTFRQQDPVFPDDPSWKPAKGADPFGSQDNRRTN